MSWDGKLYDCDFNQQLGMSMASSSTGDTPLTIWDIESLESLQGRPIRVDNHCFGCTAGSGSSCQGAAA